MTISTGATRTGRLADRGRTMHVLLDDDQGRLRLQRLRPWHRMLARFLQAEAPAGQLIDVLLKLGPVPFFHGLDQNAAARFQNTQLPLPSARLHLDPLKSEEAPMLTLITAVLAEFGLELRQLRVKYPRDSFFSKGHRAVSVPVGNLIADPADDDLYPGRKKLALRFDLPRGSYATILVKRLTEAGS